MGFTKYKPEGPRKANFLGGAKETSENENWHESPKVEEEVHESPEKKEGGVFHGPLPLEGIYKAMNMGVFQKGGLFQKNSDYYNAVVTDLARVIGSWGVSLSEDRKQIYQSFASTEYYYKQLIVSCEKYLARRSLSSQGKARQEIIANILEQAKTDLGSLRSYFGQYLSLPESERAGSVKDALVVARRKKLVMKKSDAEHKHMGEGCSRLTVFEEGDIEGSNASGFFREDVIYFNNDKKEERLFNIMDEVQKSIPIAPELLEKAKWHIKKERSGIKDKDELMEVLSKFFKDSRDKNISDFLTRTKYLNDFNRKTAENAPQLNMNLQDGEGVNFNNRNVATSRVAEVLGLGDIIAKSETVEMIGPGEEKGRKGNLMQKAQGKDASDIINESYEEVEGKKRTFDWDLADSDKLHDKLLSKVTGNFQKQMISLQVLDYLTGQVDRHLGNYFIQQDENGMLNSITGIDNDLSFGNAQANEWGEIGMQGRTPVNQEGELILPHMDKGLAQNILALTKEQLTFLLADLLEPKAIEYACQRLETLKVAIKKEMQKKDSKVFLEKTEDWNENTLNDFMNDTTMNEKGNIKSRNYLRKFININDGRNKL